MNAKQTILSKTIVALDNMSQQEVEIFLNNNHKSITHIKIGLELFFLLGPEYIKLVHKQFNLKIFLDLKLHDIPNTVSKAIKSLHGLPIQFLTIHLSGGIEMIKQAQIAAANYLPDTKLLGVSYLTSLASSDFNEIWNIKEVEIQDSFIRLFQVASNVNLDGLILSPHELIMAKQVEEKSKHNFIKITPGIRFLDEINSDNTQDQKRISTPTEAINNGADFLVIGRSLTQSSNLQARIQELATSYNAQ
ncbi:MAG: orotidine-5'-phosphate decarboxylase [Bdellovibrionales bacterium]|nr:orotidine-5'-phosphate decarboxylase [Bdellovibrionales bacterium]